MYVQIEDEIQNLELNVTGNPLGGSVLVKAAQRVQLDQNGTVKEWIGDSNCR